MATSGQETNGQANEDDGNVKQHQFMVASQCKMNPPAQPGAHHDDATQAQDIANPPRMLRRQFASFVGFKVHDGILLSQVWLVNYLYMALRTSAP